MTDIIIETNRLLLKGVSPQMIHELFLTKSEDEIKAFLGAEQQEYERFKEMHEKGMETDRFSMLFFLLIEKTSNLPIGRCGFHTWNKKHRRAELFYLLTDGAHKRKGLMTEALAAVLKYAFEQTDIHRIKALVANWNTASLRLLQHYGFSFEGTMREDYVVDGQGHDSDCYSLLRHEWQARQQQVPQNLSSATEV
jgi:ribosomal-protein-alanine N-acetyltransferase